MSARCAACGQAIPEFGGIALDDDRHEVRFAGRRVGTLTGQEVTFLRTLLDAKGNVVTREKLMSDLYSRRFHALGEEPEMKIVDVFCCKLRKKLAPIGIEIGTVWGGGYFLKEPIGQGAA